MEKPKIRIRLKLSIRLLLSFVFLCASIVFWITWPRITVRAFLARRSIDAHYLLTDEDSLEAQIERIDTFKNGPLHPWMPADPSLDGDSRTLSEVLTATQAFQYGPYVIVARRGKIGFYGPFAKIYVRDGESMTVLDGQWVKLDGGRTTR